MAQDFLGLKVIWPPDGNLPPKHTHDIIFVHGLHRGSLSDWHDPDGVCWVAEYLPVDLKSARILAFGYSRTSLRLRSDGFYRDETYLDDAVSLCSSLSDKRRSDHLRVPITFVGHGTGGIVITNTLSFAHLHKDQHGIILTKTKHILHLDVPQTELSWDVWNKISYGSPSQGSLGQWKVWAAVLHTSDNVFRGISKHFSITVAVSPLVELPSTDIGHTGHPVTPSMAPAAYGTRLRLENTSHCTITKPLRDGENYRLLLDCIKQGVHRIITDPVQISNARAWVGRPLDAINILDHQRNVARCFQGSGQWLMQHEIFHDWVALESNETFIWLIGPAGCGKSVLCSQAVEYVRRQNHRPAVVFLMLAFDMPRSEYQLASQVALQLIDYVVESKGGIDSEAWTIYSEAWPESMMLQKLHALIKVLVSMCPAIYVFIDGLDESGYLGFPEYRSSQDENLDSISKHIYSTLSFIREISSGCETTPVRLWCSSRKTSITSEWIDQFGAVELLVQRSLTGEDVTKYLRYVVSQLPSGQNPIPLECKLDDILLAAKDNFLRATIVAQQVHRHGLDTINDLDTTSDQIDLMYQTCEKSLLRSDQDLDTGQPRTAGPLLRIISLVACARRPLTINEINEALAMVDEELRVLSSTEAYCRNMNPERINQRDGFTIQEQCAPFLRFIPRSEETSDGYLRLNHCSVFEFLHKPSVPVSQHSRRLVDEDVTAEACLRYLFQQRYITDQDAAIGEEQAFTSHRNTAEMTKGHYFLPYAAKYWAKHVTHVTHVRAQTVQQFLHSPQFLNVIRLQGLLHSRHFAQDPYTGHEQQSPLKAVAQCFAGHAAFNKLASDYQAFHSEWAHVLQTAETTLATKSQIEKCCWGALGRDNFLWLHGSKIEINRTYLLTMETSAGTGDLFKETSAYFVDELSEDGTRLAVWRIPASRDGDQQPSPKYLKAVRECWFLDGLRDPFRYGSPQAIEFSTQEALWSFFDQSVGLNAPLIPIPGRLTRVPALHECCYGKGTRIGSRLFLRQKGGTWTADVHFDRDDDGYWENIMMHEHWIIRSRRRRLDISTDDENEDHAQDMFGNTDDENEDRAQDMLGNTDSLSESDEDVAEDDSDASSETSLFDSIPEYDVVSSFERIETVKVPNSKGNQNPDKVPWTLDEPNPLFSKTSRARASHGNRKNNTRVSTYDVSAAGARGRFKRKPFSYPWRLYCDICDLAIGQEPQLSLDTKSCTYYQCNLCHPGDTYNICVSCFDDGVWCQAGGHLLCRVTYTYANDQFSWDSGLSQGAVTPILDIIARSRLQQAVNAAGVHAKYHEFRYTRRHENTLHGSRPVIHPSQPLLVYPLDGRNFLFANLLTGAYFTHNVPLYQSEISGTASGTCTPIDAKLRFSSCGKYLHLARFSVRPRSLMYGTNKLHVVLVTIALSPSDLCSGKPQTLQTSRSIGLGSWPGQVACLPYTTTWTPSDLYVTICGQILRVLRFSLRIQELDSSQVGEDDLGSWMKIDTLAKTVYLPRSAERRSVQFFPATDVVPARLLLGCYLGPYAQTPVVIYLSYDNTTEWTRADSNSFGSVSEVTSPESDNMIEQPSLEDDLNLVNREPPLLERAVFKPMMSKGFRNKLVADMKRIGRYCPSCFELGFQLGFLRLPPWTSFRLIGDDVNNESQLKILWNVEPSTFVQALKAGCQFCTYVACCLLPTGSSSFIQFGQYLGRPGPRCCTFGPANPQSSDVRAIIDMLQKVRYPTGSGERVLAFSCEPLNQDVRTRSFSKVSIRVLNVVFGDDNGDGFNPLTLMIRGTDTHGERRTFNLVMHGPESKRGLRESVLELYSLHGGANHPLLENRPLSTAHGGAANLKVIQAWLDQCCSSHMFCRRTIDDRADLPKRLVQIDDKTTARLVVTDGQVGKYVALSYCWGPQPKENSMTTSANRESRMLPAGLQRNQLPGAIRDALVVSENLGFKYIWIDALCIVQDDPEDKDRELGKLCQYYRNSYLTIAASTPRCTHGFIRTVGRCPNHPDIAIPRDLVPLDAIVPLQNENRVRSENVFLREQFPYSLSDEHINGRGWTLQENLLAPRLLLFGSRVIWFCQHMTHSDGGLEEWTFDQSELVRTRREFQLEINTDYMPSSLDSASDNREIDNDSAQQIVDLWYRIVGIYSRRSISYSTDKLPALSAIAVEVARLSQDKYLAGLWRTSLPRDLLWSTPEPHTNRSSVWRAPSWSWASVNDAILYENLPPADALLLVDVITAEVVPKAANVPFGEIKEAKLHLACPQFSILEGFDSLVKPSRWKSGRNEREDLMELLRQSSRTRWTSRYTDGKQGAVLPYRKSKGILVEDKPVLPDGCILALFFAKKLEAKAIPDSTPAASKEFVEQWMTWGLVLKPVAPDATDRVAAYERVVSFSGIIMCLRDGERGFLDSRKPIQIV